VTAVGVAAETGNSTLPALVGNATGDRELAERLSAGLAEVEARLRDCTVYPSALITSAARHLLTAGGKRLRPTLTLLAAELGCAADRDQVIDAAVAVELTHLATLYHDDVIDTAPLRRGKPSAHEVWGNTAAILVGDLLLARASQLVSALGPEAVLAQARTFERLCTGQMRESIGPEVGDDPVDHYLQVLADKTASLLAVAAWYGAFYGGASGAVVDAVTEFGEKLGLAFQLSDDVLDLTASASALGKMPGTDLRDGVPTMPVLLLRARVREAGSAANPADLRLLAMLDGDLSDDAVLAAAVATLAAHDVVEATRDQVRRWVADAIAALDRVPDGPVRDALIAVAGMVAARVAPRA